MPRKEEVHLYTLVRALNTIELTLVKNQLKENNRSNNSIKLSILNSILQNKNIELNTLLKNLSITKSKFSTLKFQMFNEILQCLVQNIDQDEDDYLAYCQIKFRIFIKKGLYNKAYQFLNETLQIAYEMCAFDICYQMQLKAIEYGLFNKVDNKIDETAVRNELREFYLLSQNLNSYILLSIEVYQIHYKYYDRRVLNRSKLLKYLEHPLIRNDKSKSVISKYFYLRTKCFIYSGDNDYKKFRIFSQQTYQYLIDNKSQYRNDTFELLRSLNNFLDAALSQHDVSSFKLYFPKLVEISKKVKNKSDFHFTLTSFQFLFSLTLKYLWMTKDTKTFSKEIYDYENKLAQYELLILPNFRLEIYLGLARMYFREGDFLKANVLCRKIIEDKKNQTNLYIACGSLLSIMVNYEMDNIQLIPHLIRACKYRLKNINRLFEFEKIILNGLNKLKSHYSDSENSAIFAKINLKLNSTIISSKDMIIDENIKILEWIKLKQKNLTLQQKK